MDTKLQVRKFGKHGSCLAALGAVLIVGHGFAAPVLRTSQVSTPNGVLEGVISADDKVRTFKGIPYAAPPVGPLRWKPPQPALSWSGVRKASEYGARCMQGRIYSDMIFQDNGPSEDCLNLNLWMPAHPAKTPLPVMVWIFGGGFQAGSTSEPRQDGGNLSKQGVLVVSMNYRLGLFGFFAHPELAKESGHEASGNYGLMDQLAALKWVHENIALFGGDPQNVTIFGESAGSFSVSALMASPLAQGLFNRAIGESGAFFGDALRQRSLRDSEKQCGDFARSILGTSSLAELRKKSAGELLAAQMKNREQFEAEKDQFEAQKKEHLMLFIPNIDGYYLPETVAAIYAKGKQSHIGLLAGWNADEHGYRDILKDKAPTAQNFMAWVRDQYGSRAEDVLKLYPSGTDEQAKISARDLASDRFLGYATWKWLEMQMKTGGGQPVYRYHFEEAPPSLPNEPGGRGAYHSAEIEYVFNVLGHKSRPWSQEDYRLSDEMAAYWSNFAKTNDPNGGGLPHWPKYDSADGYQLLHLIGTDSHASQDTLRARYLLLDRLAPQ